MDSLGHLSLADGRSFCGRLERNIADPNVCVICDPSHIFGMRGALYLLRFRKFGRRAETSLPTLRL
jgi:hypothetical protein